MLGLNSHNLKHTLGALISVLVSTAEGIEYTTQTEGNKIELKTLEKIVEFLKQPEDGFVSQRFFIAVLQKMSA